MPALPFISNFQGDFVLQLALTDTDATVADMASVAAVHSVGRRVRAQPGKVIRARKQGMTTFYPLSQRIAETDIQPMDCIEFHFTDPEQ